MADLNVQACFRSITSEGIIAHGEQVDYTPDASSNKTGTVAKALDEAFTAIAAADAKGTLTFATIALMAACNTKPGTSESLDTGHLAWCDETGAHYYYDAELTATPTFGKWREMDGAVTYPMHVWNAMTYVERQTARQTYPTIRISRVVEEMPFTVTAQAANSTVKLVYTEQGATFTGGEMQYSTDGGTTWTDGAIGQQVTLSAIGDTVMYRAKTKIDALYIDSTHRVYLAASGQVALSGNVMSLLYRDFVEEFAIETPFAFAMLCKRDTAVLQGIYSIAGLALPATALSLDCYRSMFEGLTNVTTAPLLPANLPAANCYRSMFYGCTALANVTGVWLTEVAEESMRSMFERCTSLEEIVLHVREANEGGALRNTFYGCTALETADLRTLVQADYDSAMYQLFYGCTSLDDVWLGFAHWPVASGTVTNPPTYRWAFNAATDATLHLPTGTTYARGTEGTMDTHDVPYSWTVETF